MEPVQIQQIALAALCAGAVVLFGALYAVLFALGRLHGRRSFARYALASYGLLVLSTGILAVLLRADGIWAALIVVLLIGYFVAPRLVWHLNLAVHAADDTGGST